MDSIVKIQSGTYCPDLIDVSRKFDNSPRALGIEKSLWMDVAAAASIENLVLLAKLPESKLAQATQGEFPQNVADRAKQILAECVEKYRNE